MPTRLRATSLEGKPKTVYVSSTFRDPKGIANDPESAKALKHIRRCIENGTPLPSSYYSKGAGLRRDTLLSTYGIMHIHLGQWNTNELLWLVQYSDAVVLLELSDHQPFATRPPGVRLSNFHAGALAQREALLEKAAVASPRKRMTYAERRAAGLVKAPKKPS